MGGIDGSWVLSIAVVPALEVVVGECSGRDGYGGHVGVETGARDYSACGVVANDVDVGVVGSENSGKGCVGGQVKDAWVCGVTIVPLDEVVVGVGGGLNTCNGATASWLECYGGRAHGGVVGADGDGVGSGFVEVGEVFPVVAHEVSEKGTAGDKHLCGSGGGGKGVGVDGGGSASFHGDGCDGMGVGECTVANVGDRCWKGNFIAEGSTAFEGAMTDIGET